MKARSDSCTPRRSLRINRRDLQKINRVRQIASAFEGETDHQLGNIADDMREQMSQLASVPSKLRDQAFALALESVRRATGLRLYDVQILAALALTEGSIAEMQTGEGKTLSALPAAIFQGLRGHGVHMATTNAYLAERDCSVNRPACELVGVSIGCLKEDQDDAEKRDAYRCDVTYGTGYAFGFDYLRDQLTLQGASRSGLGKEILQRLRQENVNSQSLLQRGLSFAVIDEVDHVLLDEAGSPLILSEQVGSGASDASVYVSATHIANRLKQGEHFDVDSTLSRIELTARGVEFIHHRTVKIPLGLLKRPWTEYVRNALRAALLMIRDVHYVCRDDKIQIVDSSTGRIFADRSWQDGLHQAVEAKEGLSISSEKTVLAQITRQRFYRLYSNLGGMTGTAQGCEREFKQIYRRPIVPIPLRVPSQRRHEPMRFFCNRETKFQAIVEDVASVHQSRRPILVGTRTIFDSIELAERLESKGLSCQVLNGIQDADEAEIVGRGGQESCITIATNMAGRGTDIKLTDRVKQLGGLHVVIVECDESSRVDRQLMGRAGRQGDPGSCRSYGSAEDSLIMDHGPWVAKLLQRYADRNGEAHLSLEPGIRRLQRTTERRHFAARAALFRNDLDDARRLGLGDTRSLEKLT